VGVTLGVGDGSSGVSVFTSVGVGCGR
jgi:hypothetical protein